MSITRPPTSSSLSAGEHRRLLGSISLAAWTAAAASVVVAVVVSAVALRMYLAEQRAREAIEEMRAKLTAPAGRR